MGGYLFIMSGYYPAGAEYNPNAPWNQEDLTEEEIEVTVSVTLSKTMKIHVSDYTVEDEGSDEDGLPYRNLDFSNCNLKEEAKNQHWLPQEILERVATGQNLSNILKEDCQDWIVDDFEVIQE